MIKESFISQYFVAERYFVKFWSLFIFSKYCLSGILGICTASSKGSCSKWIYPDTIISLSLFAGTSNVALTLPSVSIIYLVGVGDIFSILTLWLFSENSLGSVISYIFVDSAEKLEEYFSGITVSVFWVLSTTLNL